MSDGRTVISIGTFDGVHLGHAALMERAVGLARTAAPHHSPHDSPHHSAHPCRVVALCFDPHPMTRVKPEAAPARLTTFDTRKHELVKLGAAEVVRVEPTEELLGLSAREFVEKLVREYHPAAIVEGADFRFGHGRAGSVRTLEELGRELGFVVEVVPTVDVTLDDHTVVKASSTIVRWLVTQGRVRDAGLVLGRAYELGGMVVRGDRRGRTIGFPTANLATECLLPADGVYAGVATLEDGRRFGAAVNVGMRPTFEGIGRRAEAFLLDAPGKVLLDGLPEYGWALRLELVAWLRDDLKFGSVETLVEQIERDCGRAREAVGEGGRTAGRQGGSVEAGNRPIQCPPVAGGAGARVAAQSGGEPVAQRGGEPVAQRKGTR